MLTSTFTNELAAVVEGVERSLVQVHNGRHGVGAGIIWRQDGVILTNNHVIHRTRPRVTLPGKETHSAKVIARDAEVDLALLQIDANNLPVALIADARSLQVGQIVLAIGHPWGQRGVVTCGIISALGTAATNGKRGKIPIIRSDVTLAPGNSGGPLVNIVGSVVGINTMLVGGDQGISIPSHVASEFVETTFLFVS